MIQLKILSGKMAGSEHAVRRFPFQVGRSASAGLRIEGDGVWDRHLELDFDPANGIVLNAHGDALVSVNGEQCRDTVLRNGDEIQIGALRLRFWMGATRQILLWPREWLVWVALALITAGQIVLVYQLIP